MNLSNYTCFEGMPEHFEVQEKDGVCTYICHRCGRTDSLGNPSIEYVRKFANHFHTTCPVKADLMEGEDG